MERIFAFNDESDIEFIFEDALAIKHNELNIVNGKSSPCIVAVYENEGEDIPHFHLTNPNTKDKQRRNVTYIRILENRYFDHNKPKEIMLLDSGEKRELYKWLNKLYPIPNEEGKYITNYQKIIEYWNRNYKYLNQHIPLDYDMPDYRYLHL